MKEARHYKKLKDNKVQCELCPHYCTINEGKRGLCKVRKNVEGTLIAETYEKTSAINLDPIEKKPLYHFHPKQTIFSVGSIGCNLFCKFCQNHEISQSSPDEFGYLRTLSVEKLINMASDTPDNIGIAYTYNEPTVWYEYMYDIAREAKQHKLKNIAITNGFINQAPLKELLPFMDAFNIDLKAFTNEFYQKLSGGKLDPVLDTLKLIHHHNIHLEVTNLIIPGWNDNTENFRNMVRWIKDHLGAETVLHLSRYFPVYKLTIPSTPVETLKTLQNIALKELKYVYLGNI